jgi:peptidoglycan-N-acetylglucosamine deacetylase
MKIAMKLLKALRILIEVALVAAVIALLARPPEPSAFWRTNVVYGVSTREKIVALTFDDGPHPIYTPELLDVLDKYKVKATFFMIGREMDKYPDIVRDVVKRGHVVGNHTYTHPRNIELDTEAQVIRELAMCENTIEKITGRRSHLFRPPRGLIDSTVFMVAEEEGYPTILWTVSADHHDAPTPEAMAKRVLKHMRPGGIVLAHDGTFCSRWKDIEATPLIIEGLRKQGYRFVTIPQLLKREKEGGVWYRMMNTLNFFPKP